MVELVDFYADWCGPCKIMAPIVEELKEEYKEKLEIRKVDVEVDTDMAAKFRVMSIPTFVILKDGKEVARKMGAMPKDALKVWIDESL